VREDSALSRELAGRLSRGSGLRAIGVTDLISQRRAYYRAAVPGVPIPAARQVRLDQGRTVHRVVGARLGQEGLLEARVRREGIVGRVDILSDVPIEVKTATSLVEPERLVTLRPDHLEQLGMYCALVGRSSGRLLTLLLGEQGVLSDVQALDVSFENPERVLEEMRSRADRLRTAWATSRPDALPRCPWFGRGCEFEEAKVCGCTGDEAPESPRILEEAGPIVERADVRDRVRVEVLGSATTPAAPALARFREVLYPRRAYFDRTAPAPESPPVSETSEPLPLTRPPDLYARLNEALESGPAGEVARIPPRSEEPEEDVSGFRGRPLLTRTSRAWARFRPEEIVARSPQYVLELGFRCAVTGTDSALLVLGFERAETDADRVQVLEVGFHTLTPFSRRLREQSAALSAALRERAPGRLQACPDWMVPDCPYRSECGCGTSGARSTR